MEMSNRINLGHPGEQNLALQAGVAVSVSMAHPTSAGSRDPQVLLNDTAHMLDGHAIADFDQSRTHRPTTPMMVRIMPWHLTGMPSRFQSR
jgi:hypothetical protein